MSTPQPSSVPHFANYINGEWVSSPKTFENRNPANTNEVVGTFSKGTAADMTASIARRSDSGRGVACGQTRSRATRTSRVVPREGDGGSRCETGADPQL